MKVMKRWLLGHLRSLVAAFQDPLQFAYLPHLGLDDAIIHLLQRAYSSLDKPPKLLGEKLGDMQVEAPLISDYLTGRPQFMRLQSCVSERLTSNTRELCCRYSASPPTQPTSSTTWSPVICRNFQMTRPLLGQW